MKKLIILCLLSGLTACHSIKAIERPEINYLSTLAESTQTTEVNSQWWQAFNSANLNDFIAQALANSPDLNIAMQRVIQAEIQVNNAGASLFPALTLSAATGGGQSRDDRSSWASNENSRVSLGMNYELDLWGRVSANKASAKASFYAQAYDYERAKLSLTAGVANAYFNWLSLKQKIRSTEKTIDLTEFSYRVAQSRFENGVITSAELASQQSNLVNQQKSLEPLLLQETQYRAALAILIGQEPYPFEIEEERLTVLSLPAIDQLGIPADIIQRRPDLQTAEARLSAADADVKQARSALIPTISLGLSAGRSTAEFFSLSQGSDAFSANISLAYTLFDRGRLRNQVKITQSQRIALLEQYRQAIYNALYEASDALEQVSYLQKQYQQQEQIVANTEEVLRVSNARYQQGKENVLNVLEAQRNKVQAEETLVQLYKAQMDANVNLYKALGGGWQVSL